MWLHLCDPIKTQIKRGIIIETENGVATTMICSEIIDGKRYPYSHTDEFKYCPYHGDRFKPK